LTEFFTPANVGDWYSKDVEGWFVPPETGRYRFYQSCDNRCYTILDSTTPNEINPDNQKEIMVNT